MVLMHLLCCAVLAAAQEEASHPADGKPQDLTELSLEDLMNVNVEVTSVARKPQRVSRSAAAAYVLTNEDIRRSGATTIPEVLRLVPGLEVARVSSNTWAITARGFNDQYSNKLLVLIDGRSVYTPLFSGVYWDVQDLLLEDVERIEVIRGPGATMWGANAVNGVINIITRSAKETLGGLASVGGGTEERGFGDFRYGVPLGESGAMRVWGKYAVHDALEDTSHTGFDDDWRQGRAGFRADWNPAVADLLTVEGDAYRGTFNGPAVTRQPTSPFINLVDIDGYARGEYALTRLTHTFSDHADFTAQAYFDSYLRESADIRQQVDTLDFDLEQRFTLFAGNEVTCGLGYRRFTTELDGTFDAMLTEERQRNDLWSAFVQDEYALVPDRLTLIAGSKFEHNDFTGREFQPSGRVAFTPSERQMYWAAISRAVRTPSVVEQSGVINFDVTPGAPATVFHLEGSRDYASEKLTAYEAGWRWQPADRLSLDLAAFLHDYQDLRSLEPGAPFFDGTSIIVPLTFANGLEGRMWGGEFATQWNVTHDWTLHGGYTYLASRIRHATNSADTTSENEANRNFPSHQVQARSLWNVTDTLEFDVDLFWISRVPQQNAASYLRGDVRVGWHPTAKTELSLLVAGLFHHEQPEFGSTLVVVGTEPQTGAVLRLTQRF